MARTFLMIVNDPGFFVSHRLAVAEARKVPAMKFMLPVWAGMR
jgi:hypothetical protein